MHYKEYAKKLKKNDLKNNEGFAKCCIHIGNPTQSSVSQNADM